MSWLLFSALALLLAASVIRGAPYVPTHNRQVEIALDLLDLKEGDHVVDVGSGDGKVLIAAAKRGLRATGYEINPILCAITWLRGRRYRPLVKVVWGDVWGKRLPQDTRGVFVFTMGKYMPKLEAKIVAQGLKDIKLVSHAFELPGRRVVRKREAVILYRF